jgi:extradiol dioxygenase family protein
MSTTSNSPIFHLAFPVSNIPDTKAFYVDGLGCDLGRESSSAVILNCYGHQLVAHVTHDPLPVQRGIYPRHFGLVFPELDDWNAFLQRAQTQQLQFYQAPKLRFADSPLEHHTFFLVDPFHNLLEFKHYRYPSAIFGEQQAHLIGDTSAEEVSGEPSQPVGAVTG